MTETNVSASHFRVHLKEIANSVKAGKQAVTVERHGCRMFAVVSLEDLEFLRKHKYGELKKPVPEEEAPPEPPEMITLIHPHLMTIELVDRMALQSLAHHLRQAREASPASSLLMA